MNGGGGDRRGGGGAARGRSRSKSSGRWLERHVSDPHVRRAVSEGYRSRAVWKLEEIDRRDRLLRQGAAVLELGAAPGGWSQYVAARVRPAGRVVASDVLEMDALAGVEFVRGDFTEEEVAESIARRLGPGGADVVLSDMAPNFSGVAVSDQARSVALAELALEMCDRVLKPGGAFVVKVFQGEGFDGFAAQVRRAFRTVRTRKPDASRAASREVYLVGLGARGDR